MGKVKSLLAGLGGALVLNLVHEVTRTFGNKVPRIDLLGEEALNKGLSFFDAEIEDKKTLYQATLAGDVLSNTIYFSLIGVGNTKYIWTRAIISGLSAGIGAIKLPEPMGLDERPVARNNTVKFLTVSYYLAGALVTALILSSASKK